MRQYFIAATALITLSSIARADTHDIALDLSGARPAVSVSINGAAPELWVFDTGAMGSVMNIDHARALGLPEQQQIQLGSPTGGVPQQGFLTTLTGATIGGVAMPPMRVVAAPTILPDRGGVISPNAFRGQLVMFDFAHARVRISDKAPDALPHGAPNAYLGQGMHSLPSIPVSMGAQTWSAHMDSGSPGGLTFPYEMAQSLPLAAPPVEVGHARFVDGVHTRYEATLNGVIQVGPLTLTNPRLTFIDGLPNVNVGMALLTQMTIVLDPEAQHDWALPATS